MSSIGSFNPSSPLTSPNHRTTTRGLQPATKKDVFFGAATTPAPEPAAAEESGLTRFLHGTPGVKHLYAGLKGGLQGTFGGSPFDYVGGAAILFGLTLPLALLLPGSHFVLLPAYILGRRAIRGLQQMYTGFTDPDKILKPQPESKD